MADAIVLLGESRYKDTVVYAGARGPEFALFEPPAEFTQEDVGARLHRVEQHEVGFLDSVSRLYYGEGYESFWWAIAFVNGIIDPEMEMTPGMVLTVPSRDMVLRYLARVPNV